MEETLCKIEENSLGALRGTLRTWAEVDLDAIEGNFEAVRKQLPPGKKLLVILKADAYGHGALRIAKLLEGKADYYAVAFIDEAVALRKAGIATPIMLLGHVQRSDYPIAVENDVTLAISTAKDAEVLSGIAAAAGKVGKIHLAVDTGMGRIGFHYADPNAPAEAASIAKLPGIEIEGIFSHFATADCADKRFSMAQKARFEQFVRKLQALGVDPAIKHLYNSAAIIDLPPEFDMVREGILLYGMHPSPEVDLRKLPGVRPAMALRTHIVHLKTLEAGYPISYGCTFVTTRKTKIATLCAGYADGVPRALSGKAAVLVRGKEAPILGRICMDQFMIDVTDLPEVEVGDTVTIFGEDGGQYISADALAESYGSIGYELLCDINQRVPRVYLREGEPESLRRVLPHE